MKNKDLIIERLFNAPIQLVWKALTEKELMKQWYFDLAEFKAEKGFKFEFYAGKDPNNQYLHLCEVVTVVAEKKLAYTQKYEGYEGNSTVTFELFAEDENQTKLKLTHEGLETLPVNNSDFARENFVIGWTHFIHTALKDFLDPNYKKISYKS